jgi:hypothetical protein
MHIYKCMTVVMSYFPYPFYPFSYLFPLLVLLPGGHKFRDIFPFPNIRTEESDKIVSLTPKDAAFNSLQTHIGCNLKG